MSRAQEDTWIRTIRKGLDSLLKDLDGYWQMATVPASFTWRLTRADLAHVNLNDMLGQRELFRACAE